MPEINYVCNGLFGSRTPDSYRECGMKREYRFFKSGAVPATVIHIGHAESITARSINVLISRATVPHP